MPKKDCLFFLEAGILLLFSLPLQGQGEHILKWNFLGGQYFFEGKESSLAGNAGILYSPAYEFSSRLSMVSVYNGNYRGTKEVTDLVGGGTLFQEVMGHRLSTRLIYNLTDQWAVKPFAGFKYELLKETKDEKWFKGLFDYYKADGGFEIERSFANKRSLTFGYSYFPVWFPNYESLESKTDLGRELAGKKTLNTYNHSMAASWDLPWFSQTVISVGGLGIFRSYPDQRIVEASGNYSSTKRQDIAGAANVACRKPWALGSQAGLVATAGVDWNFNHSNQNHLDANESRFLNDYYDYQDYRLSLGSHFVFGQDPEKAKQLVVSSWVSYRQYDNRLTQDTNGKYLTEKTHLNSFGFTFGTLWPIGRKGLFLRTLIQNAWQDSNMEYEANYRYNFSTFNYLLGFSYEY